MSEVVVFFALLLDRLVGEVKRFHPLVGFGWLAVRLERFFYADCRARGVAAVLLLLLPFVMFPVALQQLTLPAVVSFVDVVVLYFAIGWRSLEEHAVQVRNALLDGNLTEARIRVGYMVSRDTGNLDRDGIAGATVESVLENGNDAIFGAIFWFVIAGAPGVILYRLSNTLDAMWGYRNDRYRHYGWAAARLDDLLNLVPARLTALSYALTGKLPLALRCWRLQGTQWKSPNAGPVMAAGAGSLGVVVGGPVAYEGVQQMRPSLGVGRSVHVVDIDRALALVRRAIFLWLLVLICCSLVYHHVIFA